MKYFSVDRIEEKIAVLSDDENNLFKENLTDLPDGVKEGSVLIRTENGGYEIDNDEEDRRRKRISDLQDSIFGE